MCIKLVLDTDWIIDIFLFYYRFHLNNTTNELIQERQLITVNFVGKDLTRN